jgi:hypothetical protein
LFAAIAAFAALFAGHAFVARFGAGFSLSFRCRIVVEGGLAFGIAWFTTAAAVAVLAWAATFATTPFTTLCTFTTCWALATCLNAFGVAFVTAFSVATLTFRALTALGTVTTSATATTTAASAIGAAAITALAAFAWLFVAHGWLGFFF